jgi:predicted ATP-grasp superfamily ATP-dependent carboligase
MAEDATVYVLGMTCNGLSVVRSLGRRGIRVVAVESYRDRVSLNSRYCEVVFAPSNIIDNEEPWLDFLINLASKEKIKPVLFPTEDAYVLFLAKHRDLLSRYYEFNVAPDEIVDASVSKLGTYQLAVQCGIPTPWTYVIKTLGDYEAIAEKVTFPCALKPSYAHVWLKNYTHEKLLVIEQPTELEDRLKDLAELGIEVVLQELIPGGDGQMYVFPVYVSREGEVKGYANLKKIRQQPVDFGVGAFDISVTEPRLPEVALKLIKKSGFTGLASTEYKLDPRDGIFKLIDINPRTCMIGELAIASGVDIPYLYYCDMVGKKIQPVEQSKVGVKWWCFEWDLLSFFEYRRRGELDFSDWLSSLRGEKVYAYYAKDDPKPFLFACYKFALRAINHFLKKLGLQR